MPQQRLDLAKKSILDKLNAKIRESRASGLDETSQETEPPIALKKGSHQKIQKSFDRKSASQTDESRLIHAFNRDVHDEAYIQRLRSRVESASERKGPASLLSKPQPPSRKSIFREAIMSSESLRSSSRSLNSEHDLARIQSSGRVRDFLTQHRTSVEITAQNTKPPWIGVRGSGPANSASSSRFSLNTNQSASPLSSIRRPVNKKLPPVNTGPD